MPSHRARHLTDILRAELQLRAEKTIGIRLVVQCLEGGEVFFPQPFKSEEYTLCGIVFQ